MVFSFFDSAPKYTKILIAPDGLQSNVFGLDGDEKLHRAVLSFDRGALNPIPTYAFAPWLDQEEQFFYKIKEQFGSVAQSSLTMAFPSGVCRFVAMPFEFNRTRPSEKIDERELHNEVYQALQGARESLRKELLEEGGGNFVLQDAIMADFKIDGYSVYNPQDLKGNVVQAKLLAVFVMHEAVQFAQRVAKKLEVQFLHQTAFAALASATITPLVRNDRLGCGIFLRQDATDILLFDKGALSAVYTISVGRSIFVRVLQDAFSLPVSEAERVLLADSEGLLSRTMDMRIKKIIAPALRQWLAALELIFTERVGVHNVLPSRLVLCGNVPYPKDILVHFGVVRDMKASRALIAPESLFASITEKELPEYTVSHFIYPWIVNKTKPQKTIMGSALTIKVSPAVNS